MKLILGAGLDEPQQAKAKVRVTQDGHVREVTVAGTAVSEMEVEEGSKVELEVISVEDA